MRLPGLLVCIAIVTSGAAACGSAESGSQGPVVNCVHGCWHDQDLMCASDQCDETKVCSPQTSSKKTALLGFCARL
jgi:hypothetical protein